MYWEVWLEESELGGGSPADYIEEEGELVTQYKFSVGVKDEAAE